MKWYSCFIVSFSCILSGCNAKSDSGKLHPNISTSVEIYNNCYTKSNQLVSTIKQIEDTYIVDNKKESIKYKEKMVYTYNCIGNLQRIETYDIETNILRELLEYDKDTIINCLFHDSDTLDYSKEIKDKFGNILFKESKRKELITGILPSHYVIVNVYDSNGRLQKYSEYNVLSNKTQENNFIYKTINNTLIAEVFSENNCLFKYIYWTKKDSIERRSTYDNKINLEEIEDTYEINKKKIWVATQRIKGNLIDSIFYNEDKKIRYIHKSTMRYYSSDMEYDEYGNLQKEVIYENY